MIPRTRQSHRLRTVVAAAFAGLASSSSAQITLLNSWGSLGAGTGQFNAPAGVSVDPLTGTVYVADSLNNRIQTFTSTGGFLSSVGSFGAAAGQFNDPLGVSFDPVDRNFAVIEQNNNRVQVFQPGSTSPIHVFGSLGTGSTQFNSPAGLQYVGGTIYVADTGNNRVSAFTPAGTFLGAQNGSLNATPMNHPQGVAFDPATFILWVADTGNNLIQEFVGGINGEANGVFGGTGSGNGQFNTPNAIAASTNSRAYVSDQQNGRVQIFDANGSFITSIPATSPQGVAVNNNGQVYITDGNTIKRYLDPAAWASGVNNFTDATVGPTSVAVGAGQILGTPLYLNSAKGLVAGGTVSVLGGGTMTLSGGSLSTNILAVSASGAQFTFTSGTLTAQQINVSNGGVFSAIAGGSFGASSGISISGAGSQMDLDAGVIAGAPSVLVTGGTLKLGIATLNAGAGLSNSGDLELLGGSQISGPVVNNPGATLHSVGSSNTFRGAFTNNGTVNCESGALAFLGGYTGPGGVGGAGSVTLDQTVSTGPSPATVSFAGSVQMQPTMNLNLRLTGAASDRIAITGSGTLGGTLNVQSFNGVPPLPGQSFQPITFGAMSNDITIANQTGFAGLRFTKFYTANALNIAAAALPGDTNLDGIVNTLDFNALAAHFNAAGVNWLGGDFNGDGKVNALDFNALATNFGTLTPPTTRDAVVPEPVMALGVLLALARRRRR